MSPTFTGTSVSSSELHLDKFFAKIHMNRDTYKVRLSPTEPAGFRLRNWPPRQHLSSLLIGRGRRHVGGRSAQVKATAAVGGAWGCVATCPVGACAASSDGSKQKEEKRKGGFCVSRTQLRPASRIRGHDDSHIVSPRSGARLWLFRVKRVLLITANRLDCGQR